MNNREACTKLVVLLVLAISCCGSMQHTNAQSPDLTAQVDRLVQPYLDQKIVVGMVVGAIRGDETVVRGYGRVARDAADQPDGKTVYEIGSVSKTFTGLLLADAVVQGRVKLDQPVADLLPPGVRMPEHGEPMRLKHLATHTSGLPRLPSNLSPSDPTDPYADYDKEDLYGFLSGLQLERAPATEIAYSNLGFGLLGRVLADQADVAYGQLIQANIAKPLKMDDTATELTRQMQDRLAPPYSADLQKDRAWNFKSMAGAGAVRSTADDMLRYARAHLQPPDGALGKAIELAWNVQQPAIGGDGFAMGLGWHVARDGSTRWHNGQTGGYHAMVLINRPAKVAVVVLANTATMEVDVLGEQLVRMLVGMPEQPRTFDQTVDVSPSHMQRLVGSYQLTPGFVLTVKIEDQKLMVGATGQPFFQVYPQSEAKWNYRVVPASLTFEVDGDGPAKAVILHQNGIDQRATRQP